MSFVKNLSILLKCYSFFIFRGFANSKPQSLNVIVVVQMAKLGDMVCTTPVFRAIKKNIQNQD